MDHIIREGDVKPKKVGKVLLTIFALFLLGGGILFITLLSVVVGGLSGESSGGNIGLVKIEGMIDDPIDTINQLEKMEKRDGVKAVLIRIDSPGGAIGPTQEIYDAVLGLRKEKPVVVSMGSIAASGGYYIASAANKIVANPGTITGSIGVIMHNVIVEDLAKQLHLRWEIFKSAAVKDMISPLRASTARERKIVETTLKELHEQFVRHIADGRKMEVAEVRKIATGQIYSGEQAHALKLVDELGNIQKARDLAGKLGKIKGDPKFYRIQKHRSFSDRIFDRFDLTLKNLLLGNVVSPSFWALLGLPPVPDLGKAGR